MTNFVLIHGGGGTAAGWNLVSKSLTAKGHDVTAMDLPADDPSAGWPDYVESVVGAVGEKTDLVLVAHSASGGFVAPLVCDRLPVELIIFVNGMIPVPGEAFMEWWANTGHEDVDSPSETMELYYHDVPHEVAVEDMEREEGRGYFPSEPWPLGAWPDVASRFVLLRDDRLFPPEFMRRVVHERLGITPDEMDGGHMAMLSRPEELAEKLVDVSE